MTTSEATDWMNHPAIRALVDQATDPLPDGQAAPVVLSLHPLGSAEGLRELLATTQLVHLGFPVHRGRW